LGPFARGHVIVAQGSALTLVVGTVCLVTFSGFGIGWIVLLLRAGPGLRSSNPVSSTTRALLGRFARVVAALNRRWLGSPVVISSVGLTIGFDGLSLLLSDGFEQYHLREPNP